MIALCGKRKDEISYIAIRPITLKLRGSLMAYNLSRIKDDLEKKVFLYDFMLPQDLAVAGVCNLYRGRPVLYYPFSACLDLLSANSTLRITQRDALYGLCG